MFFHNPAFRLIAALSAVIGGLISAPASAAVLYNNLGAAQSGSDTVFSSGPLAQSFSSGVGGTLDSVSVILGNFSPAFAGQLQIDLLSDAGNAPGALKTSIGSLDFSLISSSFQTFTFNSLHPFLAANTRYWIEITSPVPSAIDWSYANDVSGTGVGSEFSYSSVLGSNSTASFGAYQMAVNAVAVPEPATLALFAAGLAGAAAMRRRTRRG